jgi:parallel beta-helix repeat protein
MSKAFENVAKLRTIVSVTDYGAKGDGVTNDTAAIQAAIDAVSAAGGQINFPAGTYIVNSALEPKSNIVFQGQGKASVLKIGAATAFEIFHKTAGALTHVTWDGLSFDGSLNYPANSTVYKQTYALRNTAIKIDVTCSYIAIQNCHFYRMSTGSVDCNAFSSSDITVRNNTFSQGSYIFNVVSVRIPQSEPSSEDQRPRRILYDGNISHVSGPQQHYDASKEDWVSSADGLYVDSCMDVTIANNIVSDCGGIGIRVEDSLRVSVIGNKVIRPGQDGIAIYKNDYDCSVVGNTIEGWGRIPFAYGIRNYSGTYVVAREFPRSAGPVLPADPTAAGPTQYFITWPYVLTGVDVSSIITYSASDYYVAQNVGILPFRGYSAINYTSITQRVAVLGNTCIGNVSTSGGASVYAGDYGISAVHPVNSSANVSDNGQNSVIVGNVITDARVYRIYHPTYQDPIAQLGLLGRAQYIGNRDDGSLISNPQSRISDNGLVIASGVRFPATQVASADPNQLDDYEEGTWVPDLTFGNASTGITYASQNGRYTKIGRVVSFVGEISLSSKGSATGIARVSSLPFLAGGTSNEEIPVQIGRYANVTGANGNSFACAIAPTEGRFVVGLQTSDSARVNLTDTAFANDTVLSFSGTYFV